MLPSNGTGLVPDRWENLLRLRNRRTQSRKEWAVSIFKQRMDLKDDTEEGNNRLDPRQ